MTIRNGFIEEVLQSQRKELEAKKELLLDDLREVMANMPDIWAKRVNEIIKKHSNQIN